MSTAKRLKEYLDLKGIAPYKAEIDCGLSNGLIAKAARSGASIQSDNLEKILSVYHDLSADWLLRGTGNMIIGEGVDQEQLLKSIGLPANSREIINIWTKFMEFNLGMQDIYKQTIGK